MRGGERFNVREKWGVQPGWERRCIEKEEIPGQRNRCNQKEGTSVGSSAAVPVVTSLCHAGPLPSWIPSVWDLLPVLCLVLLWWSFRIINSVKNRRCEGMRGRGKKHSWEVLLLNLASLVEGLKPWKMFSRKQERLLKEWIIQNLRSVDYKLLCVCFRLLSGKSS